MKESSATEAPWYRDAVFYEVPVKAFFDSNADGIGDFPGLTSKLDYLADLGVTCIWLLPFYPSPLRDDGYDVSDYRGVHPDYGTMGDFQALVDGAHRRGMKVAAEMVINHTSDRHPWFQAARGAVPGSPLRDFYLWSHDDQKFHEASVLYPEVKRSNWTWSTEARAYYWHRFFDHQPDLNYDNPQVRAEMHKVVRFWLDRGIDGLCLGGVPYLFEREGTRCEGLPQTHGFLRELRQAVDEVYPGRMLQAGVNAWPEDVLPYFGKGGECQMAPHLALAQRLFQALRQEERHPVEDVLRRTPAAPPGCQWVLLLRNHDELTLALATDEERDYMYREYAASPHTRLYQGILRRLAPLADNSRPRIELLYSLLFALPGAPVIYYGDEIGMGDNVYLGGRTAVRTPMQWSSERNAGFSTADFARLYAPPVTGPVYGYRSVNVEAQLRDPSSLWHWLRRLIAVRKGEPTLARGGLELLDPVNRKVLAFVRRPAEEGGATVLVVANLARSAQPAELDLAAFAGLVPVEMFGGAAFPRIGTSPYVLTLGPHACYWFRLQEAAQNVAARLAPVATEELGELPRLAWLDDAAAVFTGPAREALERTVLPSYLRAQRWFGGKARQVKSVRLEDWGELPAAHARAWLLLLRVQFAEGACELYGLPVGITSGPAALRMLEGQRSWALALLTGPTGDALLHDALADDAVCTALLCAIGTGAAWPTCQGRVVASSTSAFALLRGDPDYPLPVQRGPATSSNSLVFYGRRLLLKLFRRLQPGINPDFEVGRFLTEDSPFDRVPHVAGALEYHRAGSPPMTLAILQALVANQGDGWAHAIDELGRYYDRASGRAHGPDPVVPDPRPVPELAEAVPPPTALEAIGGYLHAAATLGRRTAQMHLALAADHGEANFAPQPLTANDLAALSADIVAQGRLALDALTASVSRLPPAAALQAKELLRVGPGALDALARARPPHIDAVKVRCHGDYHLGQVLRVANDWVILDFEGEPTRSLDERRSRQSPLKDIAGMVRSYHYAAYAGLFAYARDRPDDRTRLAPWADLWFEWVAAAFLGAWQATAASAVFVPRDRKQLAALLDAFLLDKAFYELAYELNNRPDWCGIPLAGVLGLLGPAAGGDTLGKG